ASGGVPPYLWSATGLPAGLALSSSGALSGTPTAPASFTTVASVKDKAGQSATQTVTIVVGLPALSPVTLGGLPATSAPATQSSLQIGLGAPYPVDVTVTLRLTFVPDSGPDDPNVQFATGGRTASLVIPAGAQLAPNAIGVQTGT